LSTQLSQLRGLCRSLEWQGVDNGIIFHWPLALDEMQHLKCLGELIHKRSLMARQFAKRVTVFTIFDQSYARSTTSLRSKISRAINESGWNCSSSALRIWRRKERESCGALQPLE
jgi:hypothetical protein